MLLKLDYLGLKVVFHWAICLLAINVKTRLFRVESRFHSLRGLLLYWVVKTRLFRVESIIITASIPIAYPATVKTRLFRVESLSMSFSKSHLVCMS